jgi:hypothetical protein
MLLLRIIFCFCLSAISLSAQTKFDLHKLSNPQTNGAEISSQLNTIEVEEYHEKGGQRIFLRNGFRKSTLVNASEWLKVRDSVKPYRVDIVYSKYPMNEGTYHEIYPLLFNRLKALFSMDAAVNRSDIEWNKILQIHCENNEQVGHLYHGIVIWYKTRSKQIKSPPTATAAVNTSTSNSVSVPVEKTAEKIFSPQFSKDDLSDIIDHIESSTFFPDSIRKALVLKQADVQISVVKTYLDHVLKSQEESSSPENIKHYLTEINEFISLYRTDETVPETFNRHSEWKNLAVVNDWTGSMYGYGAQVLQWHLQNLKRSGITSLTLFNDGDEKPDSKKKIGETGGIYSEKAGNIKKIIALFYLVMLRGSGGDIPENDIEALLRAKKTFNGSELVLIADNNACIKDIELASQIGKPVKIILCGIEKDGLINPDYAALAKITGGGIYTIDDDIENIEAQTGINGELLSMNDPRMRLTGKRCGNPNHYYQPELYTDYKKALHNKEQVEHLSLENRELSSFPKGIAKMKNLNYLNLGNNNITLIPGSINELKKLRTLDLNFNKLNTLPVEMGEMKWIRALNLAGNLFTKIPPQVLIMKNLVQLDISHNRLASVDTGFAFKRIEFLDISFNQITHLPDEIAQLKRLKYFRCTDNQLQELPAGISDLTLLEELNLEGNKLRSLPQKLYKLKKLKVLKLGGNPLDYREKERIQKELSRTEIYF